MKRAFVGFQFSFLLIMIACHSQNKDSKSGFLVFQVRHYDSISQTYNQPSIFSDRKVWYKKELVIQEIFSTIITTDTLGNRTVNKKFQYYLFIDRLSRSFYHYSSFSDTASILGSYTQSDTAELKGKGGWRFYARDFIHYTDLSFLPDTIMNGIRHKRIKFTEQLNNQQLPAVGYLRCDKKNSLFQFDENITNETGCPMVRYDYLPTVENPYPTSDEIVFVRDSLSKNELKVFEAWGRNAKNNPVKK